MSDADSRALGRTALILLVASLIRWVAAPGGGVEAGSRAGAAADVLPELLGATALRTQEADRRKAPLAEGERLDPNRAPEEELDRLPGVGPATARALVAGRAEGPYRSLQDLLRVPGVGPVLLERMAPHLALDPDAPEKGGVGPLDINRADAAALMDLPGVGPALAARIVEARRELPFRKIDDLLRIRGIGPATLERLRPLVVVGR